jgi:hypothetical protein
MLEFVPVLALDVPVPALEACVPADESWVLVATPVWVFELCPKVYGEP